MPIYRGLAFPDRLNIAHYTVDCHVREGRGDLVAIYFEDTHITFRELQASANRCGNGLLRLGAGAGDHILTLLPNRPETLIVILGAMKIGAIPVPVSTLYRARDLEAVILNSDATLLVTDAAGLKTYDEIRARAPLKHVLLVDGAPGGHGDLHRLLQAEAPELRTRDTAWDDAAFMFYTSGTTGRPKGVEHTHIWGLWWGLPMNTQLMQTDPGDIVYMAQELSFSFPFGSLFVFPFMTATSVVLAPGRFDAERNFQILSRYRVTHFCTVPTQLRMMLAVPDTERRYDLSSLRYVLTAGETLPRDVFHEWTRRFGIEPVDELGQSECHGFVANVRGLKKRPGSMGIPLAPHVVRIVDDHGDECSPGQVGHLVIQSDEPGLCRGYRKQPEEWAEVNRGGWYYTRDLAMVDDDGYFWYAARSDDIVVSRGYLISPKEVEDVLLEHPAVFEAAVVGAPDPVMGQRVKAFVRLRPDHDPHEPLREAIIEHVRSRIAPYKSPKDVQFVDDIPKTLTGKIKRKKLRDIEWRAGDGSVADQSR
ncbi:MAG TPA: acyl-CoA synthetase [Actinomycetota bacterium]|nr:acyl-CoA synthetase [Actinomycetota bacterium]